MFRRETTCLFLCAMALAIAPIGPQPGDPVQQQCTQTHLGPHLDAGGLEATLPSRDPMKSKAMRALAL